jgi:hypothetical protein
MDGGIFIPPKTGNEEHPHMQRTMPIMPVFIIVFLIAIHTCHSKKSIPTIVVHT